jgi:RHS repeat-associated protein
MKRIFFSLLMALSVSSQASQVHPEQEVTSEGKTSGSMAAVMDDIHNNHVTAPITKVSHRQYDSPWGWMFSTNIQSLTSFGIARFELGNNSGEIRRAEVNDYGALVSNMVAYVMGTQQCAISASFSFASTEFVNNVIKLSGSMTYSGQDALGNCTNDNVYTSVDEDITVYGNWSGKTVNAVVPMYENPQSDNEDNMCGNPCSVFSGNKFQTEYDYTNRYLPLVRYYNSEMTRSANFDLGWGWTHSYSDKILTYGGKINDFSTGIEYVRNNNQVVYLQSGSEAGVLHAYHEKNIALRVLDDSLMLDDNGVIKYFDKISGLLNKVVHPTHVITITRNAQDKITEVSNNFGDTLVFDYDGGDYIKAVTLPNLLTLNYVQDASDNLTTVTYQDTTGRTYHYEDANFSALLTGITDEKGVRYATWAFDSTGRAISSEHAGGAEKVTIAANRKSVVTAKGNVISYSQQGHAYSNTKKTSGRSDSNGKIASSSYYGAYGGAYPTRTTTAGGLTRNNTITDDRKLSFVQSKNTQTGEVYKSKGVTFGKRKTPIIDAQGNVTSEVLDAGDIPTVQTFDTYTKTLSFDAYGNTDKIVYQDTGSGSYYPTARRTQEIRMTYNDQRQIIAIDGRRDSNTKDYTFIDYDNKGNIAAVKAANCHTLNQAGLYNSSLTENAECLKLTFGDYTDSHQPQWSEDANGIRTVYGYDLRDRKVSQTVKYSAGDLTTTYLYDGVGLVDRVTFSDGSWLEYDYTDARYLTLITNNLGETIEIDVDLDGMETVRRIKSAAGTVVKQHSKIWSANNQLEKFISGEGFETSYSYTSAGKKESITDHLGAVITNVYDPLERIIKIIDQKQGEILRTYDANDKVTSVTDQRGIVTEYFLDGFGYPYRSISKDTATTSYTFDGAGNMISHLGATFYRNSSFDALNRKISTSYLLDSARNVTFTYDQGVNAKGRLSSVTYSAGNIALAYSEYGRVSSRTDLIDTVPYVTQYDFDSLGRLETQTSPTGVELRYTRDAVSRINNIYLTVPNQTEQSLISNISYQAFGGVKGFDYGNGTRYDLTYNLDGSAEQIEHSVAGVNFFDESYQYRKQNSIDAIVDNIDSLNSQTFAYSVKDELIGAVGKYGDIIYDYDEVGSRTLKDITGETPEVYNMYTDSNRLKEVLIGDAKRNFTYDYAGNLATSRWYAASGMVTKQLSYDFDSENRPTELVEGQMNTFVKAYDHNPFGQRIIDGNKRNIYNQRGQLIAVFDGTSMIDYIYLGSFKVALVKQDASSAEVRYFHNNYMGLPRLITDDLGTVVWSGQFKPFGELYDENAQVSNWVRFIGQYLDEDSGFYYNYFRDYDASLGRYLQSDPIGLAAGVNTYTYVGNNPVNYVDPYGQAATSAGEVLNDVTASVRGQTDRGDRNNSAIINNVISTFSDKYDACTGQSTRIRIDLLVMHEGSGRAHTVANSTDVRVRYGDEWWTFSDYDATIYYEGNIFGKDIKIGHRVIGATSDNPESPVMIFDPLNNVYTSNGIEYPIIRE